VVARVGYGLFYPRIPQIYNSAIETENGLSPNSIFLNQTKFADQQVFPQYPIPLENCAPRADSCALPASLMQFATSNISSFAHNFRTPEVHQASLSIEREVANRLIAEVSYSFVHGQNLIRARDVNLPKPASVQYPIFDSSGLNLLGYGAGQTFSTWQFSSTLTCPFPPCINPLARPLPQLRAINVFESAASSVYQGATISQRRQMTHGLYFRLGYTDAHAIDDGQDALVAGRPGTVQNSYAPSQNAGIVSPTSEIGSLSHGFTSCKLSGGWKNSGVIAAGSGRPANPTIIGDANQDGNSDNDRLPGARRKFIHRAGLCHHRHAALPQALCQTWMEA